MVLLGYDDARAVRASLHFGVTREANGQPVVTVTSDVQGPAKIEIQEINSQQIRVLDNTFRSHPDAVRTIVLLLADLKNSGASQLAYLNFPPAPGALHVQDDSNSSFWGDLVHTWKTLACPTNGWETVLDCVGMFATPPAAGIVCDAIGVETLGVGCLAAVGAGVYFGSGEMTGCGNGMLRGVTGLDPVSCRSH
jgi:hypothetical protein